MTLEALQTIALAVGAFGAVWIAAELRDLRKDVAEIWKRMERLD